MKVSLELAALEKDKKRAREFAKQTEKNLKEVKVVKMGNGNKEQAEEKVDLLALYFANKIGFVGEINKYDERVNKNACNRNGIDEVRNRETTGDETDEKIAGNIDEKTSGLGDVTNGHDGVINEHDGVRNRLGDVINEHDGVTSRPGKKTSAGNFKPDYFQNIHDHSKISFSGYFIHYLNFSQIIDLSEFHCSVRTFDIQAFKIVFSHEYMDDKIVKFILKAINDPVCYATGEKRLFYYVLLLCNFYLLKNTNYSKNKSIKKNEFAIFDENFTNSLKSARSNIYHKLRKINFLFDPKILKTHFMEIEPVNDLFFDRIIMKLFTNRKASTYCDAKFYNFYYSTYLRRDKVDPDIFYYFQKNITTSLKAISNNLQLEFLKNVFLRESVLFHFKDTKQIINFIFLFYTNKLKNKLLKKTFYAILDFFYILAQNYIIVDSVLKEIETFFENEMPIKDDKMVIIEHYYKIRNSTSFDDFFTFVVLNSESFHSTKLLVDHFLDIYRCFDIKYYSFIAILDFLGLLINKIKLEFLINVFLSLIECLKDNIAKLNLFLRNKIKSSEEDLSNYKKSEKDNDDIKDKNCIKGAKASTNNDTNIRCREDVNKNIESKSEENINDIIINITIHDNQKITTFLDKFIKTYFKLFISETKDKKKKKKNCCKENMADKKLLSLLDVIRDNEGIISEFLAKCGIERKYVLLKDKGLAL